MDKNARVPEMTEERRKLEMDVREDAERVERPTIGRTEGASADGEAARRARNPRPSVATDAGRYLRARLILSDLREKLRFGKITWQQYSTIRGQALAGDIDGAVKGLARVLLKNEAERMGLG